MKTWELVNFCEFDKYASQSYCAIHNEDESKNLGDINFVDEKNLKPFNMICGGSPCFVAGTLVLTDNGYKPIESIRVGDFVMTDKNRFRKVTQTMVNHTNSLVRFRSSPSGEIVCTENHPFLVREKKRVWNNSKRSYDRVFGEQKWVLAKDLSKSYYVCTPTNENSEFPMWTGYEYIQGGFSNKVIHKNDIENLLSNGDFWYLVGRFIGDGWVCSDGKSFKICGNKEEISEITSRMDRIGLKYCVVNEKTVCKVQVVKKEFNLYLSRFGKGASNKHLIAEVFNLPKEQLKEFVLGYVESDGYLKGNKTKVSSVSKSLIYDFSQCVQKAFGRPYSIYFTKRPKKHLIDGREVNQRDSYELVWKDCSNKQDKAFYENGYSWSPITKVSTENADCDVYNLEVEEDHTYCVQGIISHNCQDFSVAGKQGGSMWTCKDCGHEYNPLTVHYSERKCCPKCGSTNISKTRSSLLVEWLRVIEANKPNFGVYENVKNLLGEEFKYTFKRFLWELDEYGYNTYYRVLNAKDYGIPQNRERVFVVFIKKELDNGTFVFPKGFDNGLRVKDFLLDSVDEKYYINTPQAQKLIDDLVASGKLDGYGETNPLNPQNDGTCRTIKAQYQNSSTANFHREGTFGATGVVECE